MWGTLPACAVWPDPVGSSQGKDNLGHYHLDRQIFHKKCHLGQRLVLGSSGWREIADVALSDLLVS